MGSVSGKSNDDNENEEPEAVKGPVPFEKLLDRGVPTVDLISLDSSDKASQRVLREALGATEYWDVPKDAFVLTGPLLGGPECKIRTVTQHQFWGQNDLLDWAETKYRVYRYELQPTMGFWKLWVRAKPADKPLRRGAK